jgi:hypothetical protein
MKPEIAVDVDAGAVEQLGEAGLKRLMKRYSVWLITGRGEHRFAELQSQLTKQGIFPGTHYVGVTDRLRATFVLIVSPRACREVQDEVA